MNVALEPKSFLDVLNRAVNPEFWFNTNTCEDKTLGKSSESSQIVPNSVSMIQLFLQQVPWTATPCCRPQPQANTTCLIYFFLVWLKKMWHPAGQPASPAITRTHWRKKCCGIRENKSLALFFYLMQCIIQLWTVQFWHCSEKQYTTIFALETS